MAFLLIVLLCTKTNFPECFFLFVSIVYFILIMEQGFSLTSAIGHSLLKFPDVRHFSELVGQIVRLPFLTCNIWISTVVYSLFSMPIFIL